MNGTCNIFCAGRVKDNMFKPAELTQAHLSLSQGGSRDFSRRLGPRVVMMAFIVDFLADLSRLRLTRARPHMATFTSTCKL